MMLSSFVLGCIKHQKCVENNDIIVFMWHLKSGMSFSAGLPYLVSYEYKIQSELKLFYLYSYIPL
jgi:hypothetical protein